MSSGSSRYPFEGEDSIGTASSDSLPSFDTEYCPTCPVPRKELDPVTREALIHQYGGETSPLDGAPFPEHTFIIPDVPERFSRIRDQMAQLGLVPFDMTPSSLLNVFPLLTHRFFEGHYMTFYPCMDTLRRYIAVEERHLLRREHNLNCDQKDPGRLPYCSMYASLPTNTTFDVFFDAEYGTDTIVNYRSRTLHATYRTSANQFLSSIPSTTLAVSPAIMVWMRTSVLAGIHPRTVDVEHSLELGMYLMRLWFADAKTFRLLDRPTLLDPLISPLPYPMSCIGLHAPPLSLIPTATSMNPFSEHLPFHNQHLNTEPEKGGGTCRRFNSNEWSLLRYGVFLGGIAWDCDEKGRELVGDSDGPFAM